MSEAALDDILAMVRRLVAESEAATAVQHSPLPGELPGTSARAPRAFQHDMSSRPAKALPGLAPDPAVELARLLDRTRAAVDDRRQASPYADAAAVSQTGSATQPARPAQGGTPGTQFTNEDRAVILLRREIRGWLDAHMMALVERALASNVADGHDPRIR
jgi:hypothetical protein